MKKFTETYKNTKLDLTNVDSEIQEKFSSLNGQMITECCCDCLTKVQPTPMCSTELCGCEASSDVPSFPIKFFNEQEIVKKIVETLTVQDIYAIHSQFEMCQFRSSELSIILSGAPLYFDEQCLLKAADGGLLINYTQKVKNSKVISNFIRMLSKNYGINNVIVLCQINGGAAIYGIKNTGTNGKEGSIKNSLKEVYDMMNDIESNEEVASVGCCNISIDCADDVYAFAIRIGLDKMFILNSTREE